MDNSFRVQKRPYRLQTAFLLRCWREGQTWRFTLENVSTRERQAFFDPQSIVTVLDTVLDTPQARNESEE